MQNSFTSVEKYFFDFQTIKGQTTTIPYITIADFPSLGLLTSLRFLEWVYENPQLREVHGAIYLKELKVEEFLGIARRLQNVVDGNPVNI